MLSAVRSGATDTKLRARVRVGGATTTLIPDAGFLASGVWYHATLVYDQSTLKLYLNGQEIASTELTGPVDQDAGMALAIGAQPGGGNYFDGLIDDVRILQRAISTEEIQTILEEAQGNTVPVANNDAYDVIADQQFNVSALDGVLSNDSDANQDVLFALLETDADNGTVTLNDDGSFVYTPDPGFIGLDTFTYFANDGADNSNPATVSLTVDQAPNEPPVALADLYNTTLDSVLNVDAASGVLANDSDADPADTLTAVLGTNVGSGELLLNSDGSFSFTPASGFSGTETFTYIASDGVDSSQLATVTIPVHSPSNQVPVAAGDNFNTEFETELVIPAVSGVLANDTDADVGDMLTAVLNVDVTNGYVDIERQWFVYLRS